MRLTNRLGLPTAIVRAIENDDYDRGNADISITELISPPQQRALALFHADAIEEDASERIWSLIGQVAHGILDRAELKDLPPDQRPVLHETRLMTEVRGWVVSGRVDRFALYPTGKLQDYKVTSVWSVVLEGGKAKREWIEQLNSYAVLLRANGYAVESAEIIIFLRDWSKLEARRRPHDYPQTQVIVLKVPVWEPTEALTFVKGRVALHQHADRLREEGQIARLADELSCTPEDRWTKPSTWRVEKAGRKSALKICETEDQAYAWARNNGHATPDSDETITVLKTGIGIVKREGSNPRCESYCVARDFCAQYAALKAQAGGGDDTTTEEAA